MIVPNVIQQYYQNSIDLLEEAERQVKEILSDFCETHNYLFEGRIKSLESVAEKIECGRYKSWLDVDDLYACTVIIPLLTDEEKVLDFLNKAFKRSKLTKRGQVKKAPDVFRFDATRFVGCLKIPPHINNVHPLSIYNVKFEIQIKTVFEYAWTKTTHALAYKSDYVGWKRLRLVAQLKATVEQLDMLVLGFEQAVEFIGEGKWPDIEDKAKIHEFFKDKVENGFIPDEVVPKDWSRFNDNVYRILQLIQEDQPTGRSSQKIKNLTSILKRIDDYISQFNLATFPRSISLFQLVFGILLEWKEITETKKYTALITEELELHFPKSKNLNNRFSFDNED